MSAHAKIGPSGYDRWATCTASVAEIDRLGVDEDAPESIFAFEGTILHEIAAECLGHDREPHEYIGRVYGEGKLTFTMDRDHADMMVEGLDFVRGRAGKYSGGALFGVESKVSILPEHDVWGTADFWAFTAPVLTTFDWKWGRGVPVQAEGNGQAMLYAYGAYLSLPERERKRVREVEIVIEQPRNGLGGGYHSISMAELEDFIEETDAILRDMKAGKTQFKPSPKACRFCDIRFRCTHHTEWLLGLVGGSIDHLKHGDFLVPDFDHLTMKERIRLFEAGDMLRSLVNRNADELVADAMQGRKVPGYKPVAGKAQAAKWKDPEQAEALLCEAVGWEKAYSIQPISPAQARKIVPKKYGSEIEAACSRPDPKPVLVPVKLKVPALKTYDDEVQSLYERK